MEKRECTSDFARVKDDAFVSERSRSLFKKNTIEVSTLGDFHQEEESFGILKCVEQLNKEWIRLTLNHDLPFQHHIGQILSFQDRVLPEHFHRIIIPSILHQIDLCERQSQSSELSLEQLTDPFIPWPRERMNRNCLTSNPEVIFGRKCFEMRSMSIWASFCRSMWSRFE